MFLLTKLPPKPANLKNVFLHIIFLIQIREVPNDFFVDIVSSNNFLATILNQLFGFVRNNETVDLALRNRMEKFQVTQSLFDILGSIFFNRENVSEMDYKIGLKLA